MALEGGPSIHYPFNYLKISHIPKKDMANFPKIQEALYPHIFKIDPSIPYPFKFLANIPVSPKTLPGPHFLHSKSGFPVFFAHVREFYPTYPKRLKKNERPHDERHVTSLSSLSDVIMLCHVSVFSGTYWDILYIKILYWYEEWIEKSVFHDHRLSSRGKPRDAKQ